MTKYCQVSYNAGGGLRGWSCLVVGCWCTSRACSFKPRPHVPLRRRLSISEFRASFDVRQAARALLTT